MDTDNCRDRELRPRREAPGSPLRLRLVPCSARTQCPVLYERMTDTHSRFGHLLVGVDLSRYLLESSPYCSGSDSAMRVDGAVCQINLLAESTEQTRLIHSQSHHCKLR